MRIETFFNRFELFAAAPNAVEKLRELVLRMATSGRIAEQDCDDKSGHEVFKEIIQIRNDLFKRGKARSRIEGTPIDADDTIEVPSSWARCMISEVCDLQTGATPSRHESKFFVGGEVPWLVSGDINKGQIFDCEGRITQAGLENSNCKIVPANSVLIALNGQGKTRATVAVLRIAATLNQSLVAMTPYSPERLLPEYLFWNLRGRYYAIRDITGQDQRRGLNMKLVGQLSIPIPPLPEQKRIVAKVDELMALCDTLEQQQQERQTRHAALAHASLARFADEPTPDNLNFLFHKSYDITPDDLRESIRALAVRGKLVFQNRADESALSLLDRVHTHKATLAKAGELRGSASVKPMDSSEGSYEIPSSWTWVRFGQVVVNRDGERIPVSKEVRQTRAKKYDYYGASGVIDKIDDFLFDKPLLLIGEDGANLLNRSTPIAFIARGKYWVNNHAHVLDGISEDFLRYMELYINAISLEQYVTGTAQPKMNQAKMNTIPIALPPLAEQCRIVAKVDQLMALVDELEAQLAAERSAAAALMEGLVMDLTARPRTDAPVPLQASTASKRPVSRILHHGARNRAAFTTYFAQCARRHHRKVGAIASEKNAFLAEAFLGIDCQGEWRRWKHGPYDEGGRRAAEDLAANLGWFTVDKSSPDFHEVIVGSNAAEAETHLKSITGGDLDRIRAFTDLMIDWDADEAELYATLFAVWNDALVETRGAYLPGISASEVSDDSLVRRFLNWHTSKREKFTDAQVRIGLNAMRKMKLVPKGERRLIVPDGAE